MKNFPLYLVLFFTIGGFRVMSQTPDVAISYGLREYQIYLAKEYNEELSKSLKKFIEYSILNTTFYKLTTIGETKTSSFAFTFPSNPCGNYKYWGPLKLRRCREKIELLKLTDKLVRSIPKTDTDYSQISTVRSRITIKTSSILRDIDTELLKNN